MNKMTLLRFTPSNLRGPSPGMRAARATLHETSCTLAWIAGGGLFFAVIALLLVVVNLIITYNADPRSNFDLVNYLTFQSKCLAFFILTYTLLALRVALLLITSDKQGTTHIIILCSMTGVLSLCMVSKGLFNLAFLLDCWTDAGIRVLSLINIVYALVHAPLWALYCTKLAQYFKSLQ